MQENLKYEQRRIDKECHRPVVAESIRGVRPRFISYLTIYTPLSLLFHFPLQLYFCLMYTGIDEDSNPSRIYTNIPLYTSCALSFEMWKIVTHRYLPTRLYYYTQWLLIFNFNLFIYINHVFAVKCIIMLIDLTLFYK